MSLMMLMLGVIWYFLLDVIVAKSIETVGSAIVGARVEVEEADVRLTQGFITLRGLQVTNPDQPMTNLFEAEEIVADLRIGPLLQKKIFIDTLAVRDLRFNTERSESGAIEKPSEASLAIRRQVDNWAEQVTVPVFSLEGIGEAVNVGAINRDSLQTPGAVAMLGEQLDDRRQSINNAFDAADPSETLARGRRLLDSLQGQSRRDLGLRGSASAVNRLRELVGNLDNHRNALASIDDSIRALTGGADDIMRSLDEFRTRDLAYARGLLKLPSIDAPDLTPSLLGGFAVERVQKVLYWVNAVERFIPPGLDPRRRVGPKRARRAGSTVEFPSAADYPAFTLAFAEAEVTLDSGAAAGQYSARLTNLTSSPAALGRPLALVASRVGGGASGSTVGVTALFDHTGDLVRDSANVGLAGVRLPSIPVPGLATTLNLGTGATSFGFVRSGDSLSGRMSWTSSNVTWESEAAGSPIVRELQRVMEAMESVEIEVGFSGRVSSPRLSVRSNIGRVMAGAVRARLQGELARAEESIRSEIDRQVQVPLAAYQSRASEVRGELSARAAEQRARVDGIREELEVRIRGLLRGLPIGR